eukprot:m.67659 g.67659  ORF g.67659 m.67659 type:complete len:272 (-) comp11587_c0_seq1:412-1227(-)
MSESDCCGVGDAVVVGFEEVLELYEMASTALIQLNKTHFQHHPPEVLAQFNVATIVKNDCNNNRNNNWMLGNGFEEKERTNPTNNEKEKDIRCLEDVNCDDEDCFPLTIANIPHTPSKESIQEKNSKDDKHSRGNANEDDCQSRPNPLYHNGSVTRCQQGQEVETPSSSEYFPQSLQTDNGEFDINDDVNEDDEDVYNRETLVCNVNGKESIVDNVNDDNNDNEGKKGLTKGQTTDSSVFTPETPQKKKQKRQKKKTTATVATVATVHPNV